MLASNIQQGFCITSNIISLTIFTSYSKFHKIYLAKNNTPICGNSQKQMQMSSLFSNTCEITGM